VRFHDRNVDREPSAVDAALPFRCIFARAIALMKSPLSCNRRSVMA